MVGVSIVDNLTYTPQCINVDRIVGQVGDNRFNLNSDDHALEQNVSFKNGFPYDVVVVFRSGMAYRIPAHRGLQRADATFSANVRVRIPEAVKIDTHRILDAVDQQSSLELQAINCAINEGIKRPTFSKFDSVTTYSVNRTRFEAFDKMVYIHELDITVYSANDNRIVLHPYSQQALTIRQTDMGKVGEFVYRIIINDPRNLFGDRFINIGKTVYRICATVDDSMPEGVYLFSPIPCAENNGPYLVSREHIGFADADTKLPLYRTAADAEVLGDIAGQRKRELDEMAFTQRTINAEHERQMSAQRQEFDSISHKQRMEWADVEQRLRQEKQEQQERIAELQREQANRDESWRREREQYERDFTREKMEYERNSAARRDFSEMIRWLPVVITGAMVAIAKWQSLKPVTK